MAHNDQTEVPTTDLFVPTVRFRVGCKKHHAGTRSYCWVEEGLTGREIRGICNDRAKAAGMNAPINRLSLEVRRGQGSRGDQRPRDE